MADPTVSYGAYTFPSPSPFISEDTSPVFFSGQADHFVQGVTVIGNLTGLNLSGLYLQKMQMISGLLSEFQLLKITGDAKGVEFSGAKPTSISFSNSDLTTVLPYSVSFESYSSGAFSQFFGISEPKDTWDFSEQDGRISNATHSVLAKGLNVGNEVDALTNAKVFVSGRVGGLENISLFQTGSAGFLTSKNETIDRASNTYGITENYSFSTSQNPTLNVDSGVLSVESSISLSEESDLSVTVKGSIQGSIDANITGGLLTTGNFTPLQAQEVAVNAVASSLSSYETGAYTFSNRGPVSYNYDLNTGQNKLDFSFTFSDSDDTGNISHSKSTSVSISKDDVNIKVSIKGELKYNSNSSFVSSAADVTTSQQFIDLKNEYSGVIANSGLLNLAIEGLKDFTGCATGYQISGDYLNKNPLESGVNKDPYEGVISYNASFDNRVDLSTGDLTGLKISIADTRPIVVSGLKPSLVGFASQKVKERRIGSYTVSASCEGGSGQLEALENTVVKYISGVYDQGKSEEVGENTISFKLSKFY